ncbi:MAG: hypothetical protein IT285_02005 [Bdellovibrionales bacterium]|nr:hypothetical protein [Bdellovibrionales bacterium]
MQPALGLAAESRTLILEGAIVQRRLLTLILTWTLSLSTALAATPAPQAAPQGKSQKKAAAAATPAPAPSPWGFSSSLGASSNLFEPGTPDHSADLSLTLIPSYKLPVGITLSGRMDLSHPIAPESEDVLTVARTTLSARYKGWELNPFLTFTPGLTLTLPFHKDAIARQSLILGASVGPRLTYDLSRAGLTGVSGLLELTLGHNLHRYETATTGRSNVGPRVGAMGVIGWDLPVAYGLRAELAMVRAQGWSYRGSTASQSFDFNQELSWQATGQFSLAVGHNNAGSALAANGLDSNISFFNERSSTIYTSLGLSL